MTAQQLIVRVGYALELISYFFIQLIVANLQIARLLFVPNRRITPAIVSLPIELDSDFAVYTLSSMITLTPGTLSLELSNDRRFLYIHVLHTNSPEETIKGLQSGFYRRVRRTFGHERRGQR